MLASRPNSSNSKGYQSKMNINFPSSRRLRLSVCSLVIFVAVAGLYRRFSVRMHRPSANAITSTCPSLNVTGTFPKGTSPNETQSKLPFSPPDFEQVWEWEDNLPQHNLDLPYPEGEYGRYVRFSNQIQMLGFNNVLNEILMNSHLAYESRRSYVFQEYIWKKEYYPWEEALHDPNWYPRTPLNAFISGPAAGGGWRPGDSAPRAVNTDYFDKVCPKEARRILHTNDIKPSVPAGTEGSIIFDHWRTILRNATERCIEVFPADRSIDNFPQVFDLWLWGTDRILTLWERFRDSPTSKLLRASPIVAAAVERNRYLFQSRAPSPFDGPVDSFERMLAIHIRRGDYDNACIGLAHYQSTFYSWNLLPFLPDSFIVPQGGTLGNNSDENIQYYLERCFPSPSAIVRKILQSRSDFARQSARSSSTIDVLYIMTNDFGEWLDSIVRTLKSHRFHTIVTTKDLILDNEQTEVNPAIDMEIARRAAVFVGNGWSSFTSNIVHQRLVDNRRPLSIRFY